ncbi:ABC transporter permease [Myxococcus sp. CA051A]|uniref:ABC transporter permease subunit n=1 Tax=Myxococcus llanfairpwllgwyngyllgogerychwyrndrobwllllantysiliogogogochensis TaxID=2590453 RepID=A0A540X497_9BACT|nr:ABC transporter permease [Myxococcus llanfairpwllgwyngyllgogerychwyrndrobwllllantysiliogogogochensis]NTX04807.1 ABC transporter permease [Myxococcus sp. CA040A]NTX15152.1 ABC transporter permease [Myxococcus sp. CA056]NTX36150.1 ABC transporter permease [Myxococcus sp. CA033]NTX52438.1 ABC transporter permease [Myxococcus sp. CA039A]NTX63881.1 ABC transporter permease [Myxococcus sp. CA051A]
MKALLIARRELSGYLRTLSGYVVIAVILALNGLFFNAYALGGASKRSAEVLSQFFYYSSGFTIVASVFISMRLLAEERQTGTLPLLYSSPLRDRDIVLGKFLAGLAFLSLYVLCTLYMPVLVLVNGKVSFGHVAAGYLGLLLLGSASLAVGTFGSALARNQLLAAITSAVMLVALILCWLLARITEQPLSDVFSAMSLWNQHFPPFQSGLIHVRDVVYYLVVTYVALFAATRVLEARRWR